MIDYLRAVPPGVWVDLLALFLLLLGIWQGKRHGLKAECVRAIAFLAAIALMWTLYPAMHQWFTAKNVWNAPPFVLRSAMLIVTGLLVFILSFIAGTLFNFLIPFKFSPETDHALGLFPGLIRGVAYVFVALLFIAFLPADKLETIKQHSCVGRFILPRLSLDQFPAQLKSLAPETHAENEP